MSRISRSHLTATFAFVVSASLLPAQTTADTTNRTARRIVADTTLFPAGFAGTLDWKGMAPGSTWKVWSAVPLDRRPTLADVQRVYGKEDRIAEESVPALRSGSVMNSDPKPPAGVPTRQAVVFYYGSVGFGVEAPRSPASAVIIVTNRPARRP
jgi:hypothetical protein